LLPVKNYLGCSGYPAPRDGYVDYLITTHPSINLADNFELASLPTTPPEERKRLLSFVICGGGPTGVETAAVSTQMHYAFMLLKQSLRKSTTSAKKIYSIMYV
jgi:hypothetical protein